MKLEKTYPGTLDALRDAIRDLEIFCGQNSVGEDTAYAFNLCLDELFTNIVEYGYGEGPSGDVGMRLSAENGEMLMELSDASAEFNPLTDAPEPNIDAPLENRSVGGLGIFFTKKTMDSVSYARRRGRNVLTLKKRLDASLKS